MNISLEDIREAAARIRGQVQRSPMPRSASLSAEVGCNLYLKLENLQRTGSFKERGAANKLAQLSAEERSRGVICSSAGNHAQGVAYHATRLGIHSVVIMPETSPLIKVRATLAYGAEVILHGATFDDAYAKAREIAAARNLVFVHAFDDAAIIAGQGTIGLEILEDLPNVDAIVIAVGGGGLIAGVATAAKALRPEVRIIGVEMASIASMKAALAHGGPITLPASTTIAEGIAVRTVGQQPYNHVKMLVDEIVTVDDEEAANAILKLLENEKTIAEGAGAAPLAAVLYRDLGLQGKRVVVGICGGNINVNLIARIIDRGLIKDGRRVRLKVTMPDRPGELARLVDLVARAKANVMEVHHERMLKRLSLVDTEVVLALETRGPDHIQELFKSLSENGFAPTIID